MKEVSRKGAKKIKREGAKGKQLQEWLKLEENPNSFFAPSRFLFSAPLLETAFSSPSQNDPQVPHVRAGRASNHRVAKRFKETE